MLLFFLLKLHSWKNMKLSRRQPLHSQYQYWSYDFNRFLQLFLKIANYFARNKVVGMNKRTWKYSIKSTVFCKSMTSTDYLMLTKSQM